MNDASNLSGVEYFDKFCNDERAIRFYFELLETVDECKESRDRMEFHVDQLQEMYDERDELAAELVALMFKIENCRNMTQVRELIKRHRMDRYERSL